MGRGLAQFLARSVSPVLLNTVLQQLNVIVDCFLLADRVDQESIVSWLPQSEQSLSPISLRIQGRRYDNVCAGRIGLRMQLVDCGTLVCSFFRVYSRVVKVVLFRTETSSCRTSPSIRLVSESTYSWTTSPESHSQHLQILNGINGYVRQGNLRALATSQSLQYNHLRCSGFRH